jgi:amino acid adenylation domain-containing protein
MRESKHDRSRSPDRCARLSFAQERLWFIEQLEPGTALYNVSHGIRLTGPLVEEALRCALDGIVARHETLRTTFEAPDGIPTQRIHPPGRADWEKIDLSPVAEDQRMQEAQTRIVQEAGNPFDLTKDRMLRARLYRLAPDDHILLMVMHHIATDGWSMSLLLRELSALYSAYVQGKQAQLPVLPLQYADYAAWQREHLQGHVLEPDLAYWRRQLGTAPPILLLPTDRRRPSTAAYDGDRVSAVLPNSLVDQLKSMARAEGATLFMVLLASLMVLLQHYSGQDDISVGVPIAGRGHPDVENLIGFFVNMLVIREGISGDSPYYTFLKNVRKTCLNAYEHQDLPFERLVELLNPQRLHNRTPFFQVALSLMPAVHGQPEFAGLSTAEVPIMTKSAKFDLSISIWKSTAGLAISMTYPTSLFDRITVQQMLDQYCYLSEWVARYPHERIDAIPLAAQATSQESIDAINRTVRRDSIGSTIHDEFRAVVAKHSHATALRLGNRTMTYLELDRRSDQLAHYLLGAGIDSGSLVGVYLEPCFETIISYLGILKVGACYVPLDPQQPVPWLKRVIDDSRLSCVLSSTAIASNLPTEGPPILRLDAIAGAVDRDAVTSLSTPSVGADALAYVMFTSGSTGRPKGVKVLHRGVVRLVKDVDYVQLNSSTRILHLASPAFDAATFEIWGPLLNGGQCVLSPTRIPSISELGHMLLAFSIDTLWLTATWFNAIVDEDPAALSPVRQLLIGGEALSVPHVQMALRALPETTIINGYGPTEGTTFTCTYCIPRDLHPDARSVPIGRPISNTAVYILDALLRQTPPGVPGELCIGGDGLAQGYLGDPVLTEERFIANPFSERSGDRLYRTGDRVRLLPSGHIDFLGRMDRQLKIRGFRVEPGEIEHILRQHPEILDARVTSREAGTGRTELVAYVLPTVEAPVTLDSLKEYLARQLPEHMVPAHFVSLPEFPRTSTGKIDSNALPVPSSIVPCDASPYVPPRTDVEIRVSKIWAQLLGIKKLGVRDSFFELGGYSLLAVRLVAQLESAFGVSLPLAVLFDSPTIEALAERIQRSRLSAFRSTVIPLKDEGDTGPFFCVPPAGSSVYHFSELLQRMPPSISFYGIQALGLEAGERPQFRVEDMATRYIADIQEVQPTGPYYLGGRCFGAFVAYEMAQQLTAKGETVALLVLMDPSAPPGIPRDVSYYVRRAGYFKRRGRLIPAVCRHLQARLLDVWRLWIRRYFGNQHARRLARAEAAHRRAQGSYRPAPYPGRTAFLGAKADYHPEDPRALWKNLTAGDFELHLVPGDHRTITQEPNLSAFAKALEALILEARTRTAASPKNRRDVEG